MKNNLTSLAETVGVLESDPNQWDRTDTLNLAIGFAMFLVVVHPILVIALLLAGTW